MAGLSLFGNDRHRYARRGRCRRSGRYRRRSDRDGRRSISVPSLRASMNRVLAATVPEAAVLLVAGDEPEADGDLRRIEELAGHGDHTVHEVRLDDVLADFPLAGLVGGHGAVRKDKNRPCRWGEMVDQVLDPGIVGISRRRDAVLPAFVVPERLATPVAVVEGGFART